MKRTKTRVSILIAIIGLITAAVFLIPVGIDQWHIHKLETDSEWESSATALVERECARALPHIARAIIAKDPSSFPKWQDEILHTFGVEERRVVPALVEAVRGPDESARETALTAALRFGRRVPSTVEVFVAASEKLDPKKLPTLICFFASLGPVIASELPIVETWSKHANSDVRAAAMLALEQIAPSSERARKLLLEGASDATELVAAMAIDGMRSCASSPEIEDALLKTARTGKSPLSGQAGLALVFGDPFNKAARQVISTAASSGASWFTPYYMRSMSHAAIVSGWEAGFPISFDHSWPNTTAQNYDTLSMALSGAIDWKQPSHAEVELLTHAFERGSASVKKAAAQIAAEIAPYLSSEQKRQLAPYLIQQLQIGELPGSYQFVNLYTNADAAHALSRFLPAAEKLALGALANGPMRQRCGAALALGLAGQRAKNCVRELWAATRSESQPKISILPDFGRPSDSNKQDLLKLRLICTYALWRIDANSEALSIFWNAFQTLDTSDDHTNNFFAVSGLGILDLLASSLNPGDVDPTAFTPRLADCLITGPTVDDRVRSAALLLLSKIGEPATTLTLLHQTNSKKAFDDVELARALSNISSANDESLAFLEDLIERSTYDSIESILSICRNLGPAAQSLLPDLLLQFEKLDDDSDVDVDPNAVNLDQAEPLNRAYGNQLAETIAQIHPSSPKSLRFFTTLLAESPKSWEKLAALKALSELQLDAMALRTLRIKLHDRDALVRTRSARILASRESDIDSVVTTLQESLSDVSYHGVFSESYGYHMDETLALNLWSVPTNIVRREALEGLARVGKKGRRAEAEIRKQLENSHLKREAAYTLWKLGLEVDTTLLTAGQQFESYQGFGLNFLRLYGGIGGPLFDEPLGPLEELGEHLLPLLPRLEPLEDCPGPLGRDARRILKAWREKNPELAKARRSQNEVGPR